MDTAVARITAPASPASALPGAALRAITPIPASPRPPFAHQARLFDHSPDLCLLIDPATGRILACSAAARRWLGHDPDRLVGALVTCLATPDDLQQSAATWQAIAHGGLLSDADIRVARHDGTPLQLSASASLTQRAPDEAPVGLSLWRDISQRHQAAASVLDASRRLQALAYEVSVAETRERERIANGLHDDIGQFLAVAQLKLGELGSTLATPATAAQFDELRALLLQASQAMRSATFDLHSPLLQQLGLQPAIESLATRMRRWCSTRVHVEGRLVALPVDEPALAVVFRVVRELLLNVQKHAQADDAWIRLDDRDDVLRIVVEDNGRGMSKAALPQRPTAQGGYGLYSAQTQMQAIGGSLLVTSFEGCGTYVVAALPFKNR